MGGVGWNMEGEIGRVVWNNERREDRLADSNLISIIEPHTNAQNMYLFLFKNVPASYITNLAMYKLYLN